MQKYIKGKGPSRQLFETVNFAFMNFFNFLVKIAIFCAFLHSLGDSCHEFLLRSSVAAVIPGIKKISLCMNPLGDCSGAKKPDAPRAQLLEPQVIKMEVLLTQFFLGLKVFCSSNL